MSKMREFEYDLERLAALEGGQSTLEKMQKLRTQIHVTNNDTNGDNNRRAAAGTRTSARQRA